MLPSREHYRFFNLLVFIKVFPSVLHFCEYSYPPQFLLKHFLYFTCCIYLYLIYIKKFKVKIINFRRENAISVACVSGGGGRGWVAGQGGGRLRGGAR